MAELVALPSKGRDWLMEWGPRLDEKLDEIRAAQMDQEVRLREVHGWFKDEWGAYKDELRELHDEVVVLKAEANVAKRSNIKTSAATGGGLFVLLEALQWFAQNMGG